MWMFVVLVLGVVGLVAALIFPIPVLSDDDFVRGIVLTAIAGAISAFLSFIHWSHRERYSGQPDSRITNTMKINPGRMTAMSSGLDRPRIFGVAWQLASAW